MSKSLPQVGVEAVVLNSDRYFSILEKIEQSTQRTANALTKQAEKTAKVAEANTKAVKSFDPLSKILNKIDDQFGGVGKRVQSFANEMGISGDKVAQFASSLGTTPAILLGVAAAAAVAATAFVALGTRGAGLIGLAESFDRLNQSIGVDAVASLERLRMAAGGTVSDFELIRLTNLALAGSVGEFGSQFGENLPKILEIARVQARATGQDVGFLFQSLITGIKRGSPLLIDNTGLVLKVSEANEAYAASIGKTVEQLTAEEKQIAILNATLAAGQTAIDAFAGIQETAADKLMRMNATITNIVDTLAVGVQPAFGMFLDVINRVLSIVGGLVTAINPLISSFLEMGAALITGPLQAILAILDPIAKLIGFFITFATVILQPVMRAISAFGQAIGTGVTRIVQLVGDMFGAVGITLDNAVYGFGAAGGLMIAALGNAMLEAYNAVVAPVVLFIATAIADFLVGQSPPPKGPLSQIDKGGANTMMAWLDGFAGVSLQPVDEVAAAVNATLGNIGAFSMPMVEARIATLDAALEPFNSQLEIVKANFEAIATPAQQALDAIERQTLKAQEALASGDVGAAERIRQLDAQREMIEKAVDAQQQLVDSASIQQALAKSQQAPERALLAIQQARLKALETKKTPEAKAAAEAAGKGGAMPTEVTGGGSGAGGFDMSLPSVSDLISGQTAVDEMGQRIGEGFGQGLAVGINQETLHAFQNNQQLINKQVGRIQNANIGDRIAEAFSGIGTTIQKYLNEAVAIVDDWIGGITDPAREGSIPYAFNALATGDYSALVNGLLLPFDNIGEGITQFLYDYFGEDNVNSVLGIMTLLPTRIENALRELESTFNESVLVPIQDTITNVGLAVGNFFVNTGEGTLSGMIDSGVAWFTALPQRIFDALASLGGVFFAVFVTPMVGGLNLAIEAVETFVNNSLSALGTLIGSLQGIAEAVGFGEQFAEITGALVAGINLPRLAMPQAPAAQMPAAKRGGIFTGGAIRTSELGSEIMMNAASKTAVFPASVTRDIDVIARVLGGGGSMPLPLLAGAGGDTSNSTTFNQNFNLQQPPSVGNTVQQIAMLSSARGRRKI